MCVLSIKRQRWDYTHREYVLLSRRNSLSILSALIEFVTERKRYEQLVVMSENRAEARSSYYYESSLRNVRRLPRETRRRERDKMLGKKRRAKERRALLEEKG